MGKTSKKLLSRKRRQYRVRKKILGTELRPRLCVFRSGRYTYAQLISDSDGSVLGAASTKALDTGGKSRSGVEGSKLLGLRMAEIAKEKNVEVAVFDRNGYLYHGRVAAVAAGAREGGLKL